MKTNEKDTEELTQLQIERLDRIENSTYDYLKNLVFGDKTVTEAEFPWDIELIRNILDTTIAELKYKNYSVCDPSIIYENGKTRPCDITDCGMKECICLNILT